MRLFAALDVAADVAGALDDALVPVRARFDELRWTQADRWHLTVAFLGAVDAPLARVTGALAAAAAAAPARIGLELTGAGRFARRVLWLGVRDDPEGAVAALGRRAQASLAGAGLPVDRKPVRPHLTLARSRRGAPVGDEVVAAVPAVDGHWEVGDLVLYRSHLGGNRPARYESLVRLPLGG